MPPRKGYKNPKPKPKVTRRNPKAKPVKLRTDQLIVDYCLLRGALVGLGSGYMDKNVQWEGGGMDVVIRLIDPEEELAEFLYQCEEYFEEA